MRAEPITPDTQTGHLHMQAVCDAHGLTRSDIRGWSKKREMVYPRRELWFRLMILERSFSYPEAGMLTRKDHTTVLYGLRQYCAGLMGTRPNAPIRELRETWDTQFAPALQAITTFAQALAATREPVQVEPEGMGIAA